MTRHLFLLRHGAAADPAGVTDRDRPLSPTGKGQANRVGPRPDGRRVDHVLCSPAVRTRQTLELTGIGGVDVEYPERLYLADPDTVRELIAETDDAVTTLLVVGHFPGLPLAAGDLDPEGARAHGLDLGLPPAGLIVLDVAGDWAGLGPGSTTGAATITAVHTH